MGKTHRVRAWIAEYYDAYGHMPAQGLRTVRQTGIACPRSTIPICDQVEARAGLMLAEFYPGVLSEQAFDAFCAELCYGLPGWTDRYQSVTNRHQKEANKHEQAVQREWDRDHKVL